MKIITLATVAALAASTATAELKTWTETPGYEGKGPTIGEPESHSGGGGSADAGIVALAVVLGVIAFAALKPRQTTTDLSTPRPSVRPQTCLNKHGLIVSCED